MSNPNYNTTFTVDQTPEEAFAAINNPRGWWSEEIDGDTNRLGAEFKYHYKDVHRAAFKITEFVPNQRVVWHVTDNHFNFIKDQNEWVDTDVVFEILPKDGKTEVHFTHVGLVPDYECYDVCVNAWGTYITSSLRDLITTGKGQPNPIEEVVEKAREMSEQNYTTFITLDQSPDEVFAAVNNVRGWWSDDIEGDTNYLGAEFKFHSKDLHHTTQKISEFVPGKRVVWHVTESQINFVEDKEEWKDTDIVFDISKQGAKTELRFTHVGLAPAIACYAACSDAWGFYINVSLRDLIATGKGHPDYKQELPA
jgi:uncharacterized protein YndB with AHSA1/START domain